MWPFKRDPWKRINRDLLGLIHFIDTDAIRQLVDQGKLDEAFEARLVAIRIAAMYRNQSLTGEQVAKAEELLESLPPDNVRNAVARCFIQRAAAM